MNYFKIRDKWDTCGFARIAHGIPVATWLLYRLLCFRNQSLALGLNMSSLCALAFLLLWPINYCSCGHLRRIPLAAQQVLGQLHKGIKGFSWGQNKGCCSSSWKESSMSESQHLPPVASLGIQAALAWHPSGYQVQYSNAFRLGWTTGRATIPFHGTNTTWLQPSPHFPEVRASSSNQRTGNKHSLWVISHPGPKESC